MKTRACIPRIIEDRRDRIDHLGGSAAKQAIVQPFVVREMDERTPGGGLPYGALHEIAGGGAGTVDGAAATLFAAGIAARSTGKVLWCLTRLGLFFPAIAQAGLHPDRVIFCEGDKEEDVLASMEEGLSFGGLQQPPMVASRRFHLAAEKTGTMGLVVRRWRRQTEASDFGNPTAASTTRWRVSVLPSEELPVAGVGRARWLAELMRVKAGECAEFEIGACDAKGRLCLLPTLPTDRIRRHGEGTVPTDQPLVVISKSGSKRWVSAADTAARKLGLKLGIPASKPAARRA